jgi:membrane protein YqaA with SNARE-associated domain
VGSAIGELSGYLFGYGAEGLAGAEGSKTYRKVESWMKANGSAAAFVIFAFSALPNPLFDLAGLAAGSMRYPWWKFLAACALGKILKSVAFAYFGHALMP